MSLKTPDGKTFADRDAWKAHYKSLLECVDKTGETLRRDTPFIAGQSFQISRLKDCTVILLDHTNQTFIDKCEGCKIFIGPCEASVFIRDSKNCEFTVACKQLRTRNLDDSTVHLYCKTFPVVEHSTNVTFLPFNGCYNALLDNMKSARLSPELDHWNEVYDFSEDNPDVPKPHWVIGDTARWLSADFPQWVCDDDLAGAGANPILAMRRREHLAADLKVGDTVEGNFNGEGEWYPGTVEAVELEEVGAGGTDKFIITKRTFRVRYDDGDMEDAVAAYNIRAASASAQEEAPSLPAPSGPSAGLPATATLSMEVASAMRDAGLGDDRQASVEFVLRLVSGI